MNHSLSVISMIGIFVCFVPFVFAQETAPQDDLEQLVQVLRRQNPELVALREKVAAAGYRVGQAKSLMPPVIGADVEGIPRRNFSPSKYMDIEYMVMQELPGPGKRKLRARVAKEEVAMLGKEYQARELDLILELKESYYGLYFLERSLEINQENQQLLRQMAEIAQAKYTTGQTTQTDVIKAQVELAKLVNESILLEQENFIVLAKINTLLARKLDEPVVLPPSLETSFTSLNWELTMGQMLESNPLIKGSQIAREQAKTQVQLAKKEFLPDFQLRSEARHFRGEGGLREVDTFLGINLPFWFWTDRRAMLKEKKGELRASEAFYQSMRNEVLFQLQEAWFQAQAKQRIAELYQTTLVPQAQQAMEAAQSAYQTDKIDFLSWIDSQRFLKEISIEQEEAVVALHQWMARLERVVGAELPEEEKVEGGRSRVEGKTKTNSKEKEEVES